jgi:nucleotidyltransferase substrate binding protein (TIGR01987 family)
MELALASLERAIVRSQGAPADEELRDAVIQRFEYSMDLAWKMLQRCLKSAGIDEAAFRTKRDLFREGARLALLPDPVVWFEFYEARNETSHTYNRVMAIRVYEQALRFLPEAVDLMGKLKGFPND